MHGGRGGDGGGRECVLIVESQRWYGVAW